MALPILDGNQSATTLSTILSAGQHITAHTVVSLGTQAITDMRGAVSGSVVSISNFPATQTVAGTVTANVQGVWEDNQTPSVRGTGDGPPTYATGIAYDDGDSATLIVGKNSPLPISGAVTAGGLWYDGASYIPTSFKVAEEGELLAFSTLLPGTSRIGVVTIGAGTVTLGASTAQIGSVTASISGTVAVTGGLTDTQLRAFAFSVYATQPPSPSARLQVDISDASGNAGYGTTGTPLKISGSVTIGAGTAQIGSVTASIANSVTIASFATSVTIANQQGTAVTTSNFTSTTASTTLASANTARKVLTIFNEGAGNLHICAGATCTTIAYQVRLSAGDYYEVPLNQASLTHSAVFATAGSTARVCEIS